MYENFQVLIIVILIDSDSLLACIHKLNLTTSNSVHQTNMASFRQQHYGNTAVQDANMVRKKDRKYLPMKIENTESILRGTDNLSD